jgi:hypothetical protein
MSFLYIIQGGRISCGSRPGRAKLITINPKVNTTITTQDVKADKLANKLRWDKKSSINPKGSRK